MSEIPLTSFATVVSLQPRDGAHFTTLPPDWNQGAGTDWNRGSRATHGGLLAAIAIRAMQSTVDPERTLRSFAMSCVAPATPGDLTVVTQVLRTGKSLSHVETKLIQEGNVRTAVLGVFGVSRAAALRVDGPAIPEGTPPPEQITRAPFAQGLTPIFTRHFDYRFTSDRHLYADAAAGFIGGYVRPVDNMDIDGAVLAALADSFPPSVLTQVRPPASVSTVEWFVDYPQGRLVLPPNAFVRFTSHTFTAADGYATVDVKLWDLEGRLVVNSRQLMNVA